MSLNVQKISQNSFSFGNVFHCLFDSETERSGKYFPDSKENLTSFFRFFSMEDEKKTPENLLIGSSMHFCGKRITFFFYIPNTIKDSFFFCIFPCNKHAIDHFSYFL